MAGGDVTMHDQGLDFLLRQDNSCDTGEQHYPELDDKSDKVTIRGELDKISLSDIFQTLSMSKMDGILKVHRPLENRLIHFNEAGVRLLVFDRDESRRLGQRLVRSGMITTSDLRSALLEQKQTGLPLGETLVQAGILSEDRLSAALHNQLEEDLYSLFTWNTGSFEFYKGVSDEPGLAQMIADSPSFVINGVLLEVARRADEWREILRNIGSVHEVPYFVNDDELPEMSGDDLVVCEAIDESSSVQELADITMLGLFTSAKSVCDLLRQGVIAFAPATALLELARGAAHRGEHHRALLLSQTIQTRSHELSLELVQSLAEILQTCREPKMGAHTLLVCAEALHDDEAKLEIAKAAYEMDRHAIEVQQFLRQRLELLDLQGDQLFLDVTSQLCTTLSDRGDHEEALQLHLELEALQPGDPTVLTRKARLLQATGDLDGALAVLSEARRLVEATGDKSRIITLYEQILKLSPDAKDVQRALRDLRGGRARAKRRQQAMVVAMIAIAGLSWFAWTALQAAAQFDVAVEKVRSMLASRDTDSARRELATAQSALGEGPQWEELRSEISVAVATIEATRRTKDRQDVQKRLNQAGDLIEAGDLPGAAKIYRERLDHRDQHAGLRKLLQTSATDHLKRINANLDSLLDTLRQDLPGPAPVLGSLAEFRAGANRLRKNSNTDLTLAKSVLANAKDTTLKELFDQEQLQQAVDAAKLILSTWQLSAERLTGYIARIERLEKNKRLDPVFAAARGAERDHDFQGAEKLYRQLYTEYRGNPTLAPRFQDRVAKYAAINKSLRLLISSTKAEDFLDARAHYRHLRASYREFPWAEMIKLPVRIQTTPAGATVIFNGKDSGKSPLVLQCRPGLSNRIEISHPGFLREQTVIKGDEVGLVQSVLTLAPRWSLVTMGAVEKAPVADAGRIYLVDRSGTVTAWSIRQRQELWNHHIDDLSGLLTQPILYRGQVMIGSLDGPLRALDPATGETLWRLDQLPCESRPSLQGNLLVMATTDHRLVAVDLDKKKPSWSIPLSARSVLDVDLVNGCALVTLDDGTMRAISIKNRTDRWPTIKLDPGLPVQPLVHQNTIVVGTDEGHLSAYDAKTGKRLWHREGLGELRWQATATASRVLIAAPSTSKQPCRLLSFDLRSGKPGPIYRSRTGTVWTTPPAALQGSVLVGTRSGRVTVLDPTRLTLRFQIQGKGAVCAKPTALPSGDIACSFDGKELLILPPLR